MELTEILKIEAFGNFIATYASDLQHIKTFKFEKDQESRLSKFSKFLNEYRVARNVDKNKKDKLLKETEFEFNTPESIDSFAQILKTKRITHSNSIMTSLCSKIAMLKEPQQFIPIDGLAKKAIRYKKNNYQEFNTLAQLKFKDYKPEIIEFLNTYPNLIEPIEKQYPKLKKIKKIRVNRFYDKILWTAGKNGLSI